MLETSSISVIKKELQQMPKEVLIQHFLRVAKYKKESKELLNYLLFESHDEANYIRQVKEEVEAEFKTINHASIYYVKKGVQRIHRILNKYIRYSGKKATQIELLIFFCYQMKLCKTNYKRSKVLNNLYDRQIVSISKALAAVHEDLRLDFEEDLKQIL
ncbi:hypothetical protein [Carboxylicivirga sp. N1Y90]|uniref:hypothetical protein n=1 Tax=Carboxylicivirga fragile TaxID=3417571 RepID=UPI003D329AE8|nr:hypothetical protein [Marinilabiliaceae bacterium N1Y90]